MKIALAPSLMTLALLAAPVSVLAQDGRPTGGAAAATLPNTFDRPAAASRAVPTPAPAAAVDVEAAKTALRAAIVAMQAGTPDYDAMTPDLAAKIREQSARLVPMLQGYGEVQAGVHAGSENGAELFGVAFERAATQWMIALDDQGKIAVLLFRPAPLAGEATDAEAAPASN